MSPPHSVTSSLHDTLCLALLPRLGGRVQSILLSIPSRRDQCFNFAETNSQLKIARDLLVKANAKAKEVRDRTEAAAAVSGANLNTMEFGAPPTVDLRYLEALISGAFVPCSFVSHVFMHSHMRYLHAQRLAKASEEEKFEATFDVLLNQCLEEMADFECSNDAVRYIREVRPFDSSSDFLVGVVDHGFGSDVCLQLQGRQTEPRHCCAVDDEESTSARSHRARGVQGTCSGLGN